MTRRAETDLYPAIKAFWEERGYEVKAEIASADVVAVRPNDDPVVTELKLGFSLTLLQQAIARQAATRHVYVAVPKWSGRSGWLAFKGNLGLCRRLELGVLVVDFSDGSVKEYATPKPFERRINTKRSKRLKSDFDRRIGDPNMGGSQPQNILTNHRQRAEICADLSVAAWPKPRGTGCKTDQYSRSNPHHARQLLRLVRTCDPRHICVDAHRTCSRVQGMIFPLSPCKT